MAQEIQPVTGSFERWLGDLRKLTRELAKDPLYSKGVGRRWDRDFQDKIDKSDKRYAIFLGVLSIIPAGVIAYFSSASLERTLLQFFRAPLFTVIYGFLTSVLLFAGSHFNKAPRSYEVAFKLMLRVMAVYPLLGFLKFNPLLGFVGSIFFGICVIHAASRTYDIPPKNALLFYGAIYGIFAVMDYRVIV